jgi:hexosaminidase
MLALLPALVLSVPPGLSWCRAGTGGSPGWTWLTPHQTDEWDGPELIAGDELFLHETEIAFRPPRRGAIRLTLDATAPTPSSMLYTVPINIQRTTQVRAQAFVDGVAVGAPFESILRKAEWIPGSDDEPSEPGVGWTILPGRFERVPSRDAWQAANLARGTMTTIGLPSACPDGGFAMRVDGFMHCDHAGIHAFTLESDDGSTLEIDGQVIVEHRGLRGPTRAFGKAALDVGWHRFTISHIESSGGECLGLLWTTPADDAGTLPHPMEPALLRHEPTR